MQEINELDLLDGIELITKAFEKREEEKAYQLYVSKYAHMTKDNYVPFDEFFKPKHQVDNNQSVEDILGDVKNILDEFKGRWEQ